MQSIESKKKEKAMNMPLQKKQIINIIEKFEKHQRRIKGQQFPSTANAEIVSARASCISQLKVSEESPTRSNSIQGRKLSQCDAQIKVSQHSLEHQNPPASICNIQIRRQNPQYIDERSSAPNLFRQVNDFQVEKPERNNNLRHQTKRSKEKKPIINQKRSIIELKPVVHRLSPVQDDNQQRAKDMPMILRGSVVQNNRLSMRQNKNTRSHALLKNYDAPKQLEAQDIPQQRARRPYDLGLEIFDMKKELGLGNPCSSRRGDQSHRHHIDDKPQTKRRQNSSFDLPLQKNEQQSKTRDRKTANSASADRRSSRKREHSAGGSTHRKRNEAEMKKLVLKQQKEWIKKAKQQKISELMKQQKVIENLKQLNQFAEAKRMGKKPSEAKLQVLSKKPSTHFKTVDEMMLAQQENYDGAHASDNRKKKIVNIKVKPDSHRAFKEQILSNQFFIQQPSTTKKQLQPKPLFKINVKINKKPESAISKKRESINVERPKSSGILRTSVDSDFNKHEFVPQSMKHRVVFSKIQKDKENNFHVNKSHHSIITDRSDFKYFKPQIIQTSSKKKRRNAVKNNLIMKLMTQIQEHEKEIKQLKQNYSMVQLHNNSNSKERISGESNIQQPQVMKKSQSQLIEVIKQGEPKQDKNEKVVIDDDMMIFCVLSTAASIIQKKYREYKSKRKQPPPLVLNAIELRLNENRVTNEEEFKFANLSESTKFEDRFIPQPPPKKKVEVAKNGQHTFSFGHNDILEPQFKYTQNTNEQKQQQQPVQPPLSVPSLQDSVQSNQQPIEESKESSKILIESDIKQSSSEKDVKEISSKQESFNQVLKINDKFKFALRNIAEKQKHSNALIEQLQKKKRLELQQQQYQLQYDRPRQMRPNTAMQKEVDRKDRFFIKDHEVDKEEEEVKQPSQLDEPSMISDFIVVPSARDINPQHQIDLKDLIDISKLSIEPIEEDDEQPVINIQEILIQLPVNKQKEVSYDSNVSRQQQNPLMALISSPPEYSEVFQQQEDPLEESKVQQDEIDMQDPTELYNQFSNLESRQRYQSQRAQSSDARAVLDPHTFNYMSAYDRNSSNNPSKQILRNICGDEKFLQDHYYDFNNVKVSQPASPHSGSQKLLENLYSEHNMHPFLATNSSIFERNPFHDFTTNKLHEILQSKNYNEVLGMREDALKFHENLEKGYLNRLEDRKEESSKKIQNRKYELERWVSAEKQTINIKKELPINLFDLEGERKEAAFIIQKVNQKARDIKNRISGSPEKGPASANSGVPHSGSTSQFNLAMEAAKSSEVSDFINKQLQQTNSIKESIVTSKEQSKTLQQSKIEEDQIELVFEEDSLINQDHAKTNQIEENIDDDQPIVLDISHMDDEFLISSKQPSINANDLQSISINLEQLQLEKQCEELTIKILNDLLVKEIMQMSFKREPIEEKAPPESPIHNKNSADIDYDQIKELKSETSPVMPEGVQRIMEEVKEEIKSQQEIINQSIKQQQIAVSAEPQKPQLITLGIDTTEAAIEQYIEEIFEQIRPRKEQFLQAFITPIYKNPLEMLSQLQKPDFGIGATESQGALNLLDATNSLAYILNVQLYLTLEKAKENIIMETIEQIRKQYLSQSGRLNQAAMGMLDDEMADLMSEAQHIHNKVIFDCVNEGLNMVRPYSNQGEPMLWSRKPRRNLIFLFDSADDLDGVLVQVKNTVLSWAKTKAGALSSPEQADQLDDPVFNSKRERSLAQLLAKDLVKEEDKWLDYEMEEAQVKIDLSDIILEYLVGETAEIINNVKTRQLQ